MKSFLCRVMTLVFLLNCLTPSMGWGQTSRRKTNTRSLDTQVTRKVARAEQDNSPAAQFVRADQATRKGHNEQFAKTDKEAAEKRKDRLLQPDGTAIAGSTRVARIATNQPVKISSAKVFLEKLANNEIALEELVEYIDPMDPAADKNDLLTLTYAAEVLGNTVSQMAQLDSTQNDLSSFEQLLPQLEARLIYRMALLGFKTPSYSLANAKEPVSVTRTALEQSYPPSIQKTMAVGTLRLTLLKIHQYYQAKGKADPVDEYQKQMLSQRLKAPAKSKTVPENRRNQISTDLSPQTVAKRATEAVNKNGNLADFQKRFIQELKQLKEKKPQAGSYDFQHVQALAEYATAYTLEYNPKALKNIVSIFDEGVQHDLRGNVKAGDFQRDYSPILNAIFNTVFENTRYSTLNETQTQQVLQLLGEFSDPEKYSLPTRVFALEAASLLHRPFNQATLNAKQPANVFAPLNFNKPDENLRKLFAQRAVELYCPLTNESTLGVEDYGLDSKQMQALADQLAYIYDGFYDISTAVISMPGQDPHHRTTQCKMVLKNQPNRAKKNAEDAADFFDFTAQAAFWTFGGDVFMFLGTAFRLTRGAVIALPQAGRAFKMANRGEKIAAFNQEIRQGAKYANWVYKNKKQQGYVVELLVEKQPGAVPGAKAAHTTEVGPVRQAPAPEVVPQPVSHTYQLQGKYSLWNPKRWFGMSPEQKVVGMRVTRMEPGFKNTVAEAHFDTPVSGLHSMQDIENAWSQLRLVNDPATAMVYETKPYWQALLDLRQVQMEQSLLAGLGRSLKNQVDLWVPMGETAQTGGKITAATKWWNMSQWGRPQLAAQALNADMPLFVAPKTSLNWARHTADKIMNPEGIANIPQMLPGFYTSGADLATGNVQRQMFNAYFKPMNWQNGIKRTFLPDYMPTGTFWKSVQKNPMLGVQLAPQLLWRNRFAATTAFFAAWSGLDYGAYPVFEGWLVKEQTKDAKEEIAKYGDSFDPNRAKMDELLAQEMGADLSDRRAMQAYQSVAASQKQERDGTTITAPIILARRAMGMEFLDDATKQAWAQQAHRMDLNHATLQRTHQIMEQNKQVQAQNDQNTAALRQALAQDEQQIVSKYRAEFAAIPGAREKLHRAYAQYEKQVLAARTDAQVAAAQKQFNEDTQLLFAQVATYQNALQEAENLIKDSREEYAHNPGLFTATVENQIRAIYKEYARDMIALADAPADEILSLYNDALEKRDEAVWTLLSRRINAYKKAHTEYEWEETQPDDGYGPKFDPNAGQ